MSARRNILVVDLEATCWSDEDPIRPERVVNEDYPNEIIEIGAQLLEGGSLRALDEFQTFVRPSDNPVLTDFCTELTHITQSDVDDSEPFPQAFSRFVSHFGLDGRYEPIFASWGNYDRRQIQSDCHRHGVGYPFREGNHLNVKTAVAKALDVRPKGVSGMLRHLGLEFEGVPHRALEDVRNITRIMRRIKEQCGNNGTLKF